MKGLNLSILKFVCSHFFFMELLAMYLFSALMGLAVLI